MIKPITTTTNRPAASSQPAGLDRRIAPDTKWPGMCRVKLPGGGLTDMVSLARAKDALAESVPSKRRSS
jgi:hypothetical protein